MGRRRVQRQPPRDRAVGAPDRPAAPPPTPALATPAPPPTAGAPSAAGRIRASPAARRLAEQRGIDLVSVTGTGTAGAIIRADVEHHAGPPVTPSAPKRTIGPVDLDAMRTAIAAAMAR